MLVTVKVIRQSPLSHLAGVWDHLIEDMAFIETGLGWRHLWEGGTFAYRCQCAAERALAEYKRVLDWKPAGADEAATHSALMADLCAYERAFSNIAAAIEAWPRLPSAAPSPSLASLSR